MVQVSVIVPAWSAESFIGPAIASARAQTLSDIEIIVVDDCSPDQTVNAVLRAAGDDPRVRIIRLDTNKGPAGARNAALAAARGDWIAVLDADDEMAPQRLETLLGVAAAAGADIVCDAMWITPDLTASEGRQFFPLGAGESVEIDLAAFADGNHLFRGDRQSGYLKPIFRTAMLTDANLVYDEGVRIGEDYVLVAEALARGARYVVHGAPLYRYLVRPGSISRVMTAADVRALIAADDRLAVHLAARRGAAPASDRSMPGRRAARALQSRRRSLEDANAFLTMVEALKSGRYAAFARAMFARPTALRHFEMPIRKRLSAAMSNAGALA